LATPPFKNCMIVSAALRGRPRRVIAELLDADGSRRHLYDGGTTLEQSSEHGQRGTHGAA
jgi:hypothetical protein